MKNKKRMLSCFLCVSLSMAWVASVAQTIRWEKNYHPKNDDTEIPYAQQNAHCKRELYTQDQQYFLVQQVDEPCRYTMELLVQLPPDTHASSVFAIPFNLTVQLWENNTLVAQEVVANNRVLFLDMEGNKTYTLRLTGPVPLYINHDQAAFWYAAHQNVSWWRKRSADCNADGSITGDDAKLLLNTRAGNVPMITNHYELLNSTTTLTNPLASYSFDVLLDNDKQLTGYVLRKGQCDY